MQNEGMRQLVSMGRMNIGHCLPLPTKIDQEIGGELVTLVD